MTEQEQKALAFWAISRITQLLNEAITEGKEFEIDFSAGFVEGVSSGWKTQKPDGSHTVSIVIKAKT